MSLNSGLFETMFVIVYEFLCDTHSDRYTGLATQIQHSFLANFQSSSSSWNTHCNENPHSHLGTFKWYFQISDSRLSHCNPCFPWTCNESGRGMTDCYSLGSASLPILLFTLSVNWFNFLFFTVLYSFCFTFIGAMCGKRSRESALIWDLNTTLIPPSNHSLGKQATTIWSP